MFSTEGKSCPGTRTETLIDPPTIGNMLLVLDRYARRSGINRRLATTCKHNESGNSGVWQQRMRMDILVKGVRKGGQRHDS